MNERKLTSDILELFEKHLAEEEKSAATMEKYLRDARAFIDFSGSQSISKEVTIEFKQYLIDKGYTVGSINSILASVNSLLRFLHWEDCGVKSLKMQRQIYCPQEKEMTREEYLRLLSAAENDRRLWMLLQTICSTGIRVSELQYFTVEAIRRGEVTVHCKNKTRTILIPGKLRKLLLKYIHEANIQSGVIFRTKSGKPLDRSNIWSMMKRLCQKAKVSSSKVFPHNLRKLFARTFYRVRRDIAALADVLGHSNINTTRIYIMATCREHQAKIDKLDLVVGSA